MIRLILLLLVFALPTFAKEAKKVDFVAFCYHDVRPDVIGKLDPDPGALNTEHLIQHFQWLKEQGYTVISSQMIEQAKAGKITLPEKSVYLTFDDGYKSFYHTIYPLLKVYNYPATFGIVTSWAGEPTETVFYGDKQTTKADFLTWQQIKEMSDSGLVEIASHSHDLHKGVIANPQNNLQPSATSRIYKGGYESDIEFHNRIKNDLQTSFELLTKHTGKEPRTLIWPYGAFSEEVWQIAKDIGYQTSLILEDGKNSIQGGDHINRYLIDSNPELRAFKAYFQKATHKFPQRVVHLDLDYVYDPDPKQLAKNLDQMLERVKSMSVSTVYLQAFSDHDGDGNADSLYFDNQHLKVKANLFNRVAWQLKTRAFVDVYAWMPVSSFILAEPLNQQLMVQQWSDGRAIPSTNNYKRLSIFNDQAQEIIFSIYDSLGKNNKFDGILYHDDAILTDFEDVSEQALLYYKEKGLEFGSLEALISQPAIAEQWSSIKSQALIDFTHQLTSVLKKYNSTLKTARNIYAQPIINPQSESWFGQNFSQFVSNYDYTAVMAMPYMEGQSEPIKWLRRLGNIIKDSKLPTEKIVMELQTRDWRTKTTIPTEQLTAQMALLQQQGLVNYGYYPDDFIKNHPNLKQVMPFMSLNTFPILRK